jgi:hypothetical protein
MAGSGLDKLSAPKLAPHRAIGNPIGTAIALAGDMRPHQIHATASTLIDAIAYRFVLASFGGLGLFLAVSSLYLAKSAIGIDLMDGPSPLHAIFFH